MQVAFAITEIRVSASAAIFVGNRREFVDGGGAHIIGADDDVTEGVAILVSGSERRIDQASVVILRAPEGGTKFGEGLRKAGKVTRYFSMAAASSLIERWLLSRCSEFQRDPILRQGSAGRVTESQRQQLPLAVFSNQTHSYSTSIGVTCLRWPLSLPSGK